MRTSPRYRERQRIDIATTPLVEAHWYDAGSPGRAELLAVARDLREQYPEPTAEQQRKLDDVLAQVIPIWICLDAGPRVTTFRVVDQLTVAQWLREKPEAAAAEADARDFSVVLLLLGPHGGESTMHVNNPDHPRVACHMAGKNRRWYSLPENGYNWHRI